MAVLPGKRMHYIDSLHQQYGPIVRISPTEIAVADPQACYQIHRINSGFGKSQWYEDSVLFDKLTLFTIRDQRQHSARRKLFARAFGKSYLRSHWEPVVRAKVERAIERIKSEARTGKADVLKWWTFMATDTAGHLMFGESFNMLELGKVSSIFLLCAMLLRDCLYNYRKRGTSSFWRLHSPQAESHTNCPC